MGRAKQLLPFGDSTILEQVVGNTLKSEVDEIIVVLGYQAESIAPRIADKPISVAVNPDYQEGISSSIRCGLNHASKAAKAFMILLGDQPLTGSEIIDKLVAEFARSGCGIVVPAYMGRRGHPVIFSARYRAELSGLRGDIGAKGIIEAHPEDVLEVEIGSASVVADIDTESDYRQLGTSTRPRK